MASQSIVGTGSGTYPEKIYVGSVDMGTGIDRVVGEIVGQQLRFEVFAKENLAAGQYQGTMQLFACADAECARHFKGSPATVSYTISIARGFKVPANLALTALSGESPSADVAVQLPGSVTDYSLRVSGNWLTATKLGPDRFKVTAKAAAPGEYQGTVTVITPDSTRDVTVYYSVHGDATTVTRITPDVDTLDFKALETTAAPARRINVMPPSWTTVLDARIDYLPGSPEGWLSLARPGERSFVATANATRLAAGTYQAEVVFTSGEDVMPVSVPVTFTVGPASWSVAGLKTFSAHADTPATGLTQTLAIDLPGLPRQKWRAGTTSSWLKLAGTGGTTGVDGLTMSVDMTEFGKLPNFSTQKAEVVISAVNPAIAPITVQVTLEKALPELRFVSPHHRLPNEAGTYTLRGVGFANLANLKQALQVNGATPTSIARVSDTEIAVKLPAAASGSVTFAIPNKLDIATGAPALQVVAPVTYAYGALATAGTKGDIVYDPQRRAVYTANRTLGSVMRFFYNGGKWNMTSAAVPALDGVAMSPDGKTLVATATSGTLRLIDPDTLVTTATYTTAAIGGFSMNELPRLAMTSNGKAFFQGGTWGGLNYFDVTTRTFGSVEPNKFFDFYDGPWFSVSGDGNRLLIVQSAGISPSPSMLYMDSADEVTKENPAGLTFWYDGAQSLHGERFVESSSRVWDRDFNLVGKLRLPAGAYGVRSIVSPDGSRVYVLAVGTQGPRVFVFDSSKRVVTTTDLPLLGYFGLPVNPGCTTDEYGCVPGAQATVTPDGKTLFFVGDGNFIAMPIPALTPVVQSASAQRANIRAATVPSALGAVPRPRR